ncbi:MAG: hypothetical protein M3350_10845 [Actinomycetota bacterium]|nr:hypothetical protein [Actinomycetota bacterium]
MIDQTNSSTRLASGVTLTEALARRDVLALRHGVLHHTAGAGAQAQGRCGRSEIRVVRLIDVAAIRARLSTRLCVVTVPGAGVTVRGVTVRVGI